jgi:cobalt-zinc-cadmium efflux system outer membrane protein
MAIRTAALLTLIFFLLLSPIFAVRGQSAEPPLVLSELIEEALKASPEILAAGDRALASRHRIPQAKSLPDPMLMFGYQNEGFDKITLGEEPNSQGMFSLSQMFYFPGKRALKGEMATRDSEGLQALQDATRRKVVTRVRELYYDLFLSYRVVELIQDRIALFGQVEEAALARYSSGTGTQQEVVMSQTEKYMLLEREEMQRQKIEAFQAMLNAAIGRDVDTPLGRPTETPPTGFDATPEELNALVRANSPEMKWKEKMVQTAEAKLQMANKEYYPDFTISAGYYPRTKGLLDMWNLTATINLPIFYKSKQDQAVAEAGAGLSEAKRELKATEYMLSSGVRDSYSMVRAANRLMVLYRDGLLPKATQDVQLGLTGYISGKTEALTVITRIKALLDAETLYWIQRTEREKAIARIEAVTAPAALPGGDQK